MLFPLKPPRAHRPMSVISGAHWYCSSLAWNHKQSLIHLHRFRATATTQHTRAPNCCTATSTVTSKSRDNVPTNYVCSWTLTSNVMYTEAFENTSHRYHESHLMRLILISDESTLRIGPLEWYDEDQEKNIKVEVNVLWWLFFMYREAAKFGYKSAAVNRRYTPAVSYARSCLVP